jgi:probable phosphoglycerate mutase
MTELLLIRHGETAWNALRKLQGHIDIPLNAEGTRQAKALAAALQFEKLDALFSSDLLRASQTAGEIARLQGLTPRLDAELRERCFGGFEGQLYSELPSLYPEEYTEWRNRDPDFRFPSSPENKQLSGESTRAFQARVMDCIAYYCERYPKQKIAMVAHGGVLECAYRAAHDLPLNAERSITIYNASINRFIWQDGHIKLQSWGEIEHLKKDSLDEIAA